MTDFLETCGGPATERSARHGLGDAGVSCRLAILFKFLVAPCVRYFSSCSREAALTAYSRSILAVVFLALAIFGSRAAAQTAAGHWEGRLTLRGDTWPVRLDVVRTSDTTTATIDLPELGMAWHPIPAWFAHDSLTIEFPFGLGRMTAAVDSAALHAWRTTSNGDTLRLIAHRRVAFPLRTRDVTLSNGAAVLHGTFMQPAGDGPHPAVVLVHGSSPQGRNSWGYRSMADFFLRRGFAVLYYDKRGVGASTGSWNTTSFPNITDLAADLQAAVAWVRAQPGTDAGRVGVFGGSQALWVSARAAAAASAHNAIDFMILRGAPSVTPEVQELQRVRYSSDSDSIARLAVQHTRVYFDVVRGADRWGELARSVAHIRAQPWGEELLQADARDDLYWWQHNYAFDPAPDLRRLRIPMLFLYGEADTVVPPAENAARMADLVTLAPATFLIFPRANHILDTPSGPDATGQWRFPRRAPGSFEAIDAWLRANVF